MGFTIAREQGCMRAIPRHLSVIVLCSALAGLASCNAAGGGRVGAPPEPAAPRDLAGELAAARAAAHHDAPAPAGPSPPAASAPTPAPLGEPASILYGVHLASYRDMATLARGWGVLTAASGGALTGLEPRIETADLGAERGVFLRLKAGPMAGPAEAERLCAQLAARGIYCRAADFSGRPLVR